MWKILKKNEPEKVPLTDPLACWAVYYDDDGSEREPCKGKLLRVDPETFRCEVCQLEWSPDDDEEEQIQ